MAKNRHIAQDQEVTANLISAMRGRRNWLGHTGGAAKIDAALLAGATMVELITYRQAAKEHVQHLKDEHGLTVAKVNNIYRLVK